MKILENIVKSTKEKLLKKKNVLSLKEIKIQLKGLDLIQGRFKESLLNKEEAIIAEIKKASPSAGIISESFDPIHKENEYQNLGAAALSVLTEEDFFMGSNQNLKDVRAISSLPILRKDFIVDEYQIYESKLIGADCILLIASILSDEEIKNFIATAEDLKLDYLIEVHNLDELQRIEHYEDALIGVNNRNLKTFEVDINNSIKLKESFKGNNVFIAESGIKDRKDIDYLKKSGIKVFLIGESLMRGDFS